MRATTEGSLPPVMPQGNLVEVLGREVRLGSPGELMVESTPSRQRQPPCKTNKEMSDEAADAAALTYLLTCITISFDCSPSCCGIDPVVLCLANCWYLLGLISSKIIRLKNLNYIKKQQEQAGAPTKQYHQSNQR